MPPATSSSLPNRLPPLLAEMRRIVDRNGRRTRRVILLRTLGIALALSCAVVLVTLQADYYFHLSSRGRLVAFGVILLIALAALWHIARSWSKTRFTTEEIALAIEARNASTDNRLINSLQLAADSKASDAAVSDAVIRENHRVIQSLRLKQATSFAPALKAALGLLGVVAVGGGLYALQGHAFRNSLVRIFMPLAEVQPVFRTVIQIEPGNVEAVRGSDVRVTMRLEGVRPSQIVLAHSSPGKDRETVMLAPAEGSNVVTHLFKQVEDDIAYTVRGGDFRSESFLIRVPAPASLRTLRAEITPPAYTGKAAAVVDTASGHLEGLPGSKASLVFTLNRPVQEATLLLRRIGEKGQIVTDKVPLQLKGETEATGAIVFDQVQGYQLAFQQDGQAVESGLYQIRLLSDQPPQLTIEGLEREQEAEPDWSLPLVLSAEDDYGLKEVKLAYRKMDVAQWTPVQQWNAEGKVQWKEKADLNLAALNLVEGDRIEVALLASDADPAKTAMQESRTSLIMLGGRSSALQLLYEQILRTEREIAQLIPEQQGVMDAIGPWQRKLDPSSGVRWDDAASLAELKMAMTGLAARQNALRAKTGNVARSMPEAAGALRLSLGMLADTEMLRSTQIIESAPGQDTPQRKRAGLNEAAQTQDRTLKSLREILAAYRTFREEWENNQMTAYIAMLAERQTALRDNTVKVQGETLTPEASAQRQKSSSARQLRLEGVMMQAQRAVTGVSARVTAADADLGAAFTGAAQQLQQLSPEMKAIATQLETGTWAAAAETQQSVATKLEEIVAALKKAAQSAAERALAIEDERARVDGQKDIAALRSALEDAGADGEHVPISALVKIEKTRQSQKDRALDEGRVDNTEVILDEAMKKHLATQFHAGGDHTERDLRLAQESTGPTTRYPNLDNQEPNQIDTPPIGKLQDIVGDLIDEADEMSDEFDVLNVNAAFTVLDPGEVGKQGGPMNSYSASAQTGNQKPPTTSSGGASGTGRQGARSHGRNVEDVAINRRGRDEVQDGLENAPMQQGRMQEVMSDDPQSESSAGMGGKRIDSEEKGWSTRDAGTWKDEYADQMEKPQQNAKLVDRQGPPLDPRVAAMLEDHTSTQEQVLVRAKAIRKELQSLHLPTERLDDLIAKIAANLERLKESPESNLFKSQKAALEQLREELQVIGRAHSGYHPSVPRQQQIKGRVLDEPAWQPLPQYEGAVRSYFEDLATQ